MKGEATPAELAPRFEVHPTLAARWKKQAPGGLAEVFASSAGKRKTPAEAGIKELHVKIGQLAVERDF